MMARKTLTQEQLEAMRLGRERKKERLAAKAVRDEAEALAAQKQGSHYRRAGNKD